MLAGGADGVPGHRDLGRLLSGGSDGTGPDTSTCRSNRAFEPATSSTVTLSIVDASDKKDGWGFSLSWNCSLTPAMFAAMHAWIAVFSR